MIPRMPFSPRTLIGAVSLWLLLGGILSAAAPMARTPAPGYYRMGLGRFEVTALHDGRFMGDTSLLKGIDAATMRSLLDRRFIGGDRLRMDVNAYLVNTGDKLVLVDAGVGEGGGPETGRLRANLRDAGYDSGQVDAVLVTHLHGDHIAGLIDEAGKPAFANAVVYAAKAEADFFLSAETAAQAPPARQKTFELARTVAAAYRAAGRWVAFTAGELPLAGIRAIPIPGHTPGHTAYEIRSEGQVLLIWGDLVHAMAVQLARPEATLVFDSDPAQAVATRRALLRRCAAERIFVAGMHMPFPGIGRLWAEAADTYDWVPVDNPF